MQVEYAWNPIALCQDRVAIDVVEGLSPNQIILSNAMMFSRPVMCMVNGNFWSRQDWDFPVPLGGEVRFVELPRGGGDSNPLKILAIIAVVVAAYYTGGLLGGGMLGAFGQAAVLIGGSLLIGMMFGADKVAGAGDYGTAKTIYSVSGGSNRLRIGEPFSEHFGRMIVFPDLMQLSYTRMENNEQYLYFLGIVGVGDYAIEGVYINKTPMLEYADTSYAILPPGIDPSMIPTVVWSSAEISGQDISIDWFSVVVSGPGTIALYIEYDLQFPQLIAYDDSGNAGSASVGIVTEARLIDARGNATGAWLPLHSPTYTAASKDTLRYSNKIPAPGGPGRYEFRIRRTAAPSEDAQVSNKANIMGLRAYGDAHPDYGNITKFEARIKATDQLNGEVASKINLVVTRKLSAVTDFGLDPTPTPSRSIIDAVAYIITSSNGGNQPQSFINFPVLNSLKSKLDSVLGHWFDWRFTGRTTVMSACVKVAQCGRCVPYMPGGQFAIVRDEYQSLPKMVYSEDDYDVDSLNLVSTFATADSPTYVRVKYIDSETWQDEEVVYYDSLGSELTPYEIVLEGCTGRQQAWEMAAYIYKDMMLNTISVDFTTGLKGHLPTLFSKTAISMANVDWGQSGKIAAVEPGLIWLSEPVDFGSGNQGKIYISTPDGVADGPHTVTEVVGNPYCVFGTIPGLLTLDVDNIRATPYIFGPYTVDPLFIRIMHIAPQGRNKVKLTGTIVTNEVYDSPGPAGDPSTIVTSGSPLSAAFLTHTGGVALNHQYSLVWVGSAEKFKVELYEGTSWRTLADPFAGYQISFSSTSNAVSLLVTPYNPDNVTLNTMYQRQETYAMTPAPTGLTLVNMDADSIDVAWTAITGASGYDVSIMYDGIIRGSRRVNTTTASVSTEELQAIGGPWGTFYVIVSAVIGTEKGSDATLKIDIDPLATPAAPVLQSLQAGGFIISWNSVPNATGYMVYLGTTNNFDASQTGTLAYSGPNTSAIISASMAPPYDHYVRVAATNGYHSTRTSVSFSPPLAVELG